MLVSGVTGYEIQRILDGINKDFQTSLTARDLVAWQEEVLTRTGTVTGTRHRARFMLRLQDSADIFHRRSGAQWRRTNGVCFDGMTLFMWRLFQAHPDAKVKTSKLSYSDQADFRKKWRHVATSKEGGGGSYADLCDCDQDAELMAKVAEEWKQIAMAET